MKHGHEHNMRHIDMTILEKFRQDTVEILY